MITDATILNADIGTAAAIATTKLGAGAIVQVVNVTTGAVATGTTTMPNDDSIPQKTEGDEYMTLAITPTSASNKLFIEVSTVFSHSANDQWLSGALFQDTTAGALASVLIREDIATVTRIMSLNHYMAAGTTSATTFKLRVGSDTGGTTTFNGYSGRAHGGVMSSSITITEIKV
jgi:hypothetical protein